MMSFDFSILNYLQEHRTAFGDTVMPLITYLGNAGAIWIVLGAVLCFFPKYRKAGITVLTALVLTLIVCNLCLKPLVARERPFIVNPGVELLISAPTDYSFPSGHTASSFAAAFALLFSKNKLWCPSMVLAALIAFSRLYLYVHYPSDVFAGIFLGFILGMFASLIYSFAVKRMKKVKS